MSYSTEDRKPLLRELYALNNEGVSLLVEGRKVRPGARLVDTLLGESGCTYMRNYRYENGKVVEINFNKIIL